MEMSHAAVDDIICHLLLQDTWRSRPARNKQAQLGEGEIRSLCAAAKDVFMRQPNLVHLDAPISIYDDVHLCEHLLCCVGRVGCLKWAFRGGA